MKTTHLLCLTSTIIVAAMRCSSYSDGNVSSQSSSLVAPAPTNVAIPGTQNNSETASAYVPFGPSGAPGRWITAWNYGWSHSTDINATLWTTAQPLPSNPLAFGDPGISCSGTGRPIQSLGSDPSLTRVTNPANSQGGTRAMYSIVGFASGADDVLVTYSDDGGGSWRGASWAGDSTSCNVDAPSILANPEPPYDVFAAWDAGIGTYPLGRLQKIAFDTTTNCGGSACLHKAYPTAKVIPGNGQLHSLGFIKLPAGCSSGGEGVAIVSLSGLSDRCEHQLEAKIHYTWQVTVFDNGFNTFYGPWTIADEPNAEHCVTDKFAVPTDNNPGIATDPTNGNVWVPFVSPTPYGERANVFNGVLSCNGSSPALTGTTWTSPDPCNPVGGVCTHQINGQNIIQDEWEIGIGFGKTSTQSKRVVAYWYGTRDDVNNQLTNVYMSYSENGGPWASPPIAVGHATVAGTSVPWDPYAPNPPGNFTSGMVDYNRLGVDYTDGKFLAVWGGDNRNALGHPYIVTDLLQ